MSYEPRWKEVRVFLNDLTKVFDYDFLYNNVPWSGTNSPDEIYIYYDGNEHEWYKFGRDENIEKFKFDEIKIHSMHGFAGTVFDLFFRYKNSDLYMIPQNGMVAKTVEDLKKKKIEHIYRQIEHIDALSQTKPSLFNQIENIKKMDYEEHKD